MVHLVTETIFNNFSNFAVTNKIKERQINKNYWQHKYCPVV